MTGKGQGCCWSPPDSYAPARVSHGSDPSKYNIASVIFDGSPITIGERPCECAGAGDNVLGGNRGGGMGEGVTRERRRAWGRRGGGGKGVWKNMCK